MGQLSWADPVGGQGVQNTPENPKYRVSLQYWSESPEKITKLPSQHSMFGHYQPTSDEMAFRWWADDGPFIAVFVSSIPL